MLAGELPAEEADDAIAHLRKGIADVMEMGWFPENDAEILNEVELIDTDGTICRPDRVVISEGKVSVIDFKFGEHHKKYERQVRRYADIWKRMGYAEVSASLWYVHTGEVMRIL